MKGNYFAKFSLSVVVYDLDRAKVERACADFYKVFSVHDAQIGIQEVVAFLVKWQPTQALASSRFIRFPTASSRESGTVCECPQVISRFCVSPKKLTRLS